jgi:leader peptidase (prepilin peptidase)/N-methyltransferase
MYVLYGLLGCIVGSFLNVVIDRAPAGRSIISPPSHCSQCGRQLSARDMLPVISFVALRGRCRACGARIPWRVLWVELASGLLFGFLWWVYGPGISLVQATVYTCILLVILVIDLEHKLVLNVIILPAIALALLLMPLQTLPRVPSFANYGLLALLFSVRGMSPWTLAQWSMLSIFLGGLSAFAIFWLICIISPEGMGYGDVKLAAFAGLVTAFPGALAAVFGSFILGGIVAIGLLASGVAQRKTAIPFAPFLCLTTFVVMVFGEPLLLWYLAR